jgi:hypothetical protein
MMHRTLRFLLPAIALTAFAHAAIDPATFKSDARFFTDASFSTLKPGITAKDLPTFKSEVLKEVAAGLLDGTYDKAHRAAAYRAYPSPRQLGETLKLGDGFSRYENITGIHLNEGENVVFVGPMHGKRISLLLPDWMRKPSDGVEPTKDPNGWGLRRQEVELKEGWNVFNAERPGNAYISYFDDHAEDAEPITVHFPTGKVNGYFDLAKHDNKDWVRLLDNAVGPIMDARGTHIQVAYPVEWFKEHTKDRGVELIRNYDTMLKHHFTLLGLVKYDNMPVNRILSRVNFNYYMFRDRDGVAYLGTKNVMGMVADPDRVIKGDPCWGFSHEAGHVLQMRPQITWGGMTEVSVNLFSLYTGGKMGNSCRISHQKNYASARKNIIEAEPRISYLQADDVFDRLVPFWQLHLHFTKNGKPDFYPDVMEEMRRRPDAGKGNDSILNQFQFIEICCDVTRTDLTDFFDQWGFFHVGEIKVNDYGRYRFNVTRETVDEVKARIAAKHYPKPATDITRVES